MKYSITGPEGGQCSSGPLHSPERGVVDCRVLEALLISLFHSEHLEYGQVPGVTSPFIMRHKRGKLGGNGVKSSVPWSTEASGPIVHRWCGLGSWRRWGGGRIRKPPPPSPPQRADCFGGFRGHCKPRNRSVARCQRLQSTSHSRRCFPLVGCCPGVQCVGRRVGRRVGWHFGLCNGLNPPGQTRGCVPPPPPSAALTWASTGFPLSASPPGGREGGEGGLP